MRAGCASCRALKAKWYEKLRATGFDDIEYGMENPRFIAHAVDPSAPGTEQAKDYYDRVSQIFHNWKTSGRSPRDCRVAELYATQQGNTGTVRGISRTLKAENLAPWSTKRVQITLNEIREAVRAGTKKVCGTNSIESTVCVYLDHAAA